MYMHICKRSVYNKTLKLETYAKITSTIHDDILSAIDKLALLLPCCKLGWSFALAAKRGSFGFETQKRRKHSSLF